MTPVGVAMLSSPLPDRPAPGAVLADCKCPRTRSRQRGSWRSPAPAGRPASGDRMRLASKIFLGFSLVIVVLAAVGVLSLRAVRRLVSLNREVASETLPALRLTADVRDAMLALARLQ